MNGEMPPVPAPKRIEITADDLGAEPTQPPPPAAEPPPAVAHQQALPALQPPRPPEKPAAGAFCRACGNALDPRAVICTSCGVATGQSLPQAAPSYAAASLALKNKSSGLAILLSLFFVGAGQWYCGRVGRGIAFFVGYVVSWLLVFVIIGLVLVPIVAIWAAVDAYRLAEAHNRQLLTEVTGVAAVVP
jgi:TM2 domain-containing membrane protein YozV